MSDYLGLILLALLSFLLVVIVRRWAIRQHMVDQPNYRSSHSVPRPRGGGLAIVVSFLLALSYLALVGQLDVETFLALAGGGALVAAIGYRDDRRDLPARVRLIGHFAAAIWATAWIGGIPSLDLGFTVLHWGWVGYAVSVVGIVWLLNLYNFMDGIDGIAASEAVFVAGTGGVLLLSSDARGLGLTSLSLAAACVGFLFWNWPPAKIFMGDVGSGFLGYVLAVLAIASDQTTDVSLWVWLVLLSVFVVDATVTLLRRLLQREKVYQAHRSHAYQHITALLGSHVKVTLGVAGINCLGLLPLALIAWNWPNAAPVTAAIAVLLLTSLAIFFNAGVKTGDEDNGSAFPVQTPSESTPYLPDNNTPTA